jgi:hypothetical protein
MLVKHITVIVQVIHNANIRASIVLFRSWDYRNTKWFFWRNFTFYIKSYHIKCINSRKCKMFISWRHLGRDELFISLQNKSWKYCKNMVSVTATILPGNTAERRWMHHRTHRCCHPDHLTNNVLKWKTSFLFHVKQLIFEGGH